MPSDQLPTGLFLAASAGDTAPGEWPPELTALLVTPGCASAVQQAWRMSYRARVWAAGNEQSLRFLCVALPPPPISRSGSMRMTEFAVSALQTVRLSLPFSLSLSCCVADITNHSLVAQPHS
jgi:hypothetical protein